MDQITGENNPTNKAEISTIYRVNNRSVSSFFRHNYAREMIDYLTLLIRSFVLHTIYPDPDECA